MKLKYLLLSSAVLAYLATSGAVDQYVENVEESTRSPIEEQTQVTDSELKTTTDKQPTTTSSEQIKNTSEEPQSSKPTLADFIIRPLIALKPRTPADDTPIGKQATTTLSAPWTIFGFNPGQSFGSLAGSFSGWITDRIPAFVDTPVRDPITTTTPRPERITHPTYSPNRQRPNQLDYYEVEEDDNYDDDDEDFEYEGDDEGEELVNAGRNIITPKFGGPNNLRNDDEEIYDDYENEDKDNNFVPEVVQRANYVHRPDQSNENFAQQQKSHLFDLQRQQMLTKELPLQQANQFQYDDLDDDLDDNLDENFYDEYPPMKRSQNEIGLIQRAQQNLMNQFRKLRRGPTASRKPQEASIRQPVAYEVPNRGGLKFTGLNSQVMVPQQVNKRVQPNMSQQPKSQSKLQIRPQSQSLSPQLPFKQKNRPTQYIAIPWSRLSMTPSHTSSQLKPIIFNIPQSAIDQIKKGTILTEESLVNLMKPTRVESSQANTITTKKPKVVATTKRIVTQKKPFALSLMNSPPRRVHPGTKLKKVFADAATMDQTDESDNDSNSKESQESNLKNHHMANSEREYIIIGDDDEPGTDRYRQVQPVHGNERLLQTGISPYLELLARQQQKAGRALEDITEAAANHEEIEQKIPVEIIFDEKFPENQSPQEEQLESIES